MNRTSPGIEVQAVEWRKTESKPGHRVRQRGKVGGKAKRERQPGDMKALKMQQILSNVSYGHRTKVKDHIHEMQSFCKFPLLPLVQDSITTQALRDLDDVRPTPIQRLAIPALLGAGDKKGRRSSATLTQQPGMQQFLLAAETGSGKTLAYLLPVIDAIKRAETAEAEEASRRNTAQQQKKGDDIFALEPPPLSSEQDLNTARPRAIVLLPTAELVDQIGRLFKAFSHTVKIRVAMLSASYSAVVVRNRLFSDAGVDVVLSTPHLLASIADTTPNILSRVTHLVIDEADSLLDRSFAPLTTSIVDRAAPCLKQLVLCSATIPRSLDNLLRKRYPDMTRLTTPNLHAIPRRVQLSVVDIEKEPYRSNRDLACADTIWSIGGKATGSLNEVEHGDKTKRILVFVNEREKARELASYLLAKGIDAAPMNRDTPEQRSGEILAAFTSRSPVPMSDSARVAMADGQSGRTPETRRILPNTKVLVMTDLGSRGIDTVAVRNVVLYDVPHSTIDFIHRLGRTGRMGMRGRGVVLVGKDDRRDVVREVREGMFMGKALI